MENDNTHYTMSLPHGNQIFLVQGKKFMIPKACLVRNSIVFSDSRFDNFSNAPVELGDDADDFAEFCNVIYSPFESCLFDMSPDLAKVLGVLKLANKYCAASIESRTRSVAVALTRPEVLKLHIKPPLTAASIFDTATTVHCEDIYDPIWKVILEDFAAGRVSMIQLLELGERGGRRLLGEAYYHIMLLGSDLWLDPSGPLSSRHRWNLTLGWTKCAQAWDKLAFEWGSDSFRTARYCFDNRNCVVGQASQLCASRRIASTNITERLEVISNIQNWCGCRDSVVSGARELLALFKADLAQFFLSDPEPIHLAGSPKPSPI